MDNVEESLSIAQRFLEFEKHQNEINKNLLKGLDTLNELILVVEATLNCALGITEEQGIINQKEQT